VDGFQRQVKHVAFLPTPNQNRHGKTGSKPILTLFIPRFFFQSNVILSNCDRFDIIHAKY
jgi:hypothetical protein